MVSNGTVQFSGHQPHVATEHVKCGSSAIRCAVSVKMKLQMLSASPTKENVNCINSFFFFSTLLTSYRNVGCILAV